MIDKDFMRDFFGMRRQTSEQCEFVVSREICGITDNQHPNYPKTLFRQWTEAGWEVVSVTVRPRPGDYVHDCEAIGVLRRLIPCGSREA